MFVSRINWRPLYVSVLYLYVSFISIQSTLLTTWRSVKQISFIYVGYFLVFPVIFIVKGPVFMTLIHVNCGNVALSYNCVTSQTVLIIVVVVLLPNVMHLYKPALYVLWILANGGYSYFYNSRLLTKITFILALLHNKDKARYFISTSLPHSFN